MIFLTVGSQLPFDRLVAAMDAWAGAHPGTEIFGQILNREPGCLAPANFPYKPLVAPAEFDALCRQARIIVGHAGTGTLISALTYRKPLVMMPRRADLHEHRNDHQLATAGHFRALPGVAVVEDAAQLAGALDRILTGGDSAGTLPPHADPALIAAIRGEIFRDRS